MIINSNDYWEFIVTAIEFSCTLQVLAGSEMMNAWLIERQIEGKSPAYVGVHVSRFNSGEESEMLWIDSAFDALKFADKESAEKMAKTCSALLGKILVTEHHFDEA